MYGGLRSEIEKVKKNIFTSLLINIYFEKGEVRAGGVVCVRAWKNDQKGWEIYLE